MEFEPPMLQTVTEQSDGFSIRCRQRRHLPHQPRQKSVVAVNTPRS